MDVELVVEGLSFRFLDDEDKVVLEIFGGSGCVVAVAVVVAVVVDVNRNLKRKTSEDIQRIS